MTKAIASIVAGLALAATGTTAARADVAIADNHQTIAVDCAKDANVTITGNHAAVTLTGVCASVSIAGNHATVTGRVKSVALAGNHNTLTLDAVDSVSVPGNHNTVTYLGTVDAKLKAPKISKPGKFNTISKGAAPKAEK